MDDPKYKEEEHVREHIKTFSDELAESEGKELVPPAFKLASTPKKKTKKTA